MSGSGTVVTGTLWSGDKKPDQAVVVQPSGRQVRVRSVQVHGQKKEHGVAASASRSTSSFSPKMI